MKIAIIGTGAAGLSAAWALAPSHDITVFEAADRLGGHANTAVLPKGPTIGAQDISVDTGFIVYNTSNYPNFVNWLDAVGAETEDSDMSFGVSIANGKIEYLGEPAGLFAQKRNALRPAHWQMIRDMLRFFKNAPGLLETARQKHWSLGDMIEEGGYSDAFAFRHMLPMAAAIWSTPVSRIRDFPAETFIQFFNNHKLFEPDINARPIWRTVSGGSKTYVDKVAERFADKVSLSAPVQSVSRTKAGFTLSIGSATTKEAHFDQVVFACHSDQALKLLGSSARPGERTVLGDIAYAPNRAVLHQDTALLPKRPKAWASWNYLSEVEMRDLNDNAPVALTYWMNRLQNLQTTEPVLVTLNPVIEADPAKTFGIYEYDHPIFDRKALNAQKRLQDIQGVDGAWFCGAWCGYGFHEDGASSGFAVARALGAPTPWASKITEMSPAGEYATPIGQKTNTAIAAE